MNDKTTDPFLTNKTLLQRVRDQYDDHSWEEFADVYQNFIYSLIREMNILPADIDDILQQVMMKLWKALPDLNPQEIRRFRSYLATVTKHCVLDFMKARKRQINREEKAGSDAALNYLEGIRIPEIEQIADREWETFLHHRAFMALEKKYSEQSVNILQLFLEGLDVEEVAEKSGVDKAQVYNIRFRMKKRFAAEIAYLRQNLQ